MLVENKRGAFHDAEEETMVAALVEELPEAHQARTALRRGLGTIQICRLVECDVLARRLRRAYVDACARMLRRHETDLRT
jgi:hypothetical protein